MPGSRTSGRDRWRLTTRGRLVVAALVVQAAVLGVGWLVTFRVVQRAFARVIETQIIEQNRRLASTIAELFPAQELAEASGGVPFMSEAWERLQRVVETEALSTLPAGGFACLIEPDGHVLCHPDIRQDPSIRSYSFQGKTLRSSLDDAAGALVTQAGAAGQFASGVVDFSLGDTHFVATAPLGDSGLRLLVHQPIDAVVMASRRGTWWVVAIAAGVLVTVLGVTGGGLMVLLRRYDGVHEQLNRQLRENLRTAQRIQMSTLPRAWPDVPGYDIAAWSRPADETGGDTFDVVGLAEEGAGYRLVEQGRAGSVALALADATGHGVGPAIAVTQLHAMFRVAWRMTRDLAGVAGLLSERLAESLPEGRFITAWLARLDHERDEVEMFSAGQGPVFMVRESGDVHVLETDSFPLGIDAGLLGGPRRVPMAPGDAVVVISDGLVEAVDAGGEQFGVERMTALLREARGRDAAGIAGAIRAAVDAFEAPPQRDDQTLVIVKRHVACKLPGVT